MTIREWQQIRNSVIITFVILTIIIALQFQLMIKDVKRYFEYD